MIRLCVLMSLLCSVVSAQAPDPAYDPLQKAYEALRARRYDTAIGHFREAVNAAPDRPSIRKDLAYAYLKTGENEAARDEFAEAMRLAPDDVHVALEYAFLCQETRRTAEARRIFDRIRQGGDPAARETAERAFQNVDRPLGEGIERWSRALELSPNDFSAHHELARLAEQREDYGLAAEHYYKAWKLRPELRALLIGLGRSWKGQGLAAQANAAFLAASRAPEPRAAEEARGFLPARYPYVYEFRDAIGLDPKSVDLRRELAFLLLAMEEKDEAEKEFAAILEISPDDLLSAAQLGFLRLARKDTEGAMPLLKKVLEGADEELAGRVRSVLHLRRNFEQRSDAPGGKAPEAKTLADRSYEAGYLRDALKYYSIAHETDPLDFSVILKLGWTHNVLKQDAQAVRWFELARKSPDLAIAGEAARARNRLRPPLARYRTTVWMFPIYSSRWRDVFSYGQIKAEVKLGSLPVRSYLSMRFIGDTRHVTSEAHPQYLSESSLILGAGLATDPRHGLSFWGEAGSAVNYLERRPGAPRMAPDYRGGVSFNRGFGSLLGGESAGLFFETNDDGVFLSRFDDDFLLYSQNRLGFTLPAMAALGGLQTQFYWNGNVIADTRRQYWANVAESGPGIRFRWKAMPPGMLFTVNYLRGAYTLREGNPRGPNFWDLRAGVWYAVSR